MLLGRTTLRDHWTSVDGVRVYARASREPAPAGRTPVVLLHGFVISSSYMVPTAVRLAPELPVWAVDLPGTGRSDRPQRTLTIPELAESLLAWMNAVGLRRASFLGNSLGCQVIANFAARFPARVERVVLVGPTVDAGHRTVREQVARLFLAGKEERPSLLLLQLFEHLRAWLRFGPRHVLATLEHTLADRIEESLPRIGAPTLVVRGSDDVIVTHRWAEEVARLLLDGSLVVIPRRGHALNFSAADELVRVVRPFLLHGVVDASVLGAHAAAADAHS